MLKGLRKLRAKKWVAFVTNIYVLILSAFLVWMIFFDTNSFLIQQELQSQIQVLESEKEYLIEEIKKDRAVLKSLSTDEAIERFAREKYLLKKKNEEVFIIEYQDSLSSKKND